MKITISMPEILIIFSLFMFQYSWSFSVIAFCLGTIARFAAYANDLNMKKEQQKETEEAIENLAGTLNSALKL